MKTKLLYVMTISCLVTASAKAQVFFSQDFNGKTLTDIQSATPDATQFDKVGVGNTTSGSAGGWGDTPTGSISVAVNNNLTLSRNGGQTGDRSYFVRTGLNPVTDFIKVSFKFKPTGIANTGSTQASFQFGTGHSKDGATQASGATLWETVGISHISGGKFALRDGTGTAVNGTSYDGGYEYIITLYMNATTAEQTYTGPDGQSRNLASNKWHAFVDNEIQFDGESGGGISRSKSSNGPTRITDFKFYMSGGAATYEFDDLKMEALPIATTPVSLTSFTGVLINNAAELKWVTVSESNNSHFNILRSTDGKSFTQIGREEGHGTTQAINNYVYRDFDPVEGENYYQLQQVDKDATVTNLGIRLIKAFSKKEFSVYSNEGKSYVRINNSGAVQKAKLVITNTLGQKVFEKNIVSNNEVVAVEIPLDSKGGIYIAALYKNGQLLQQVKFKK